MTPITRRDLLRSAFVGASAGAGVGTGVALGHAVPPKPAAPPDPPKKLWAIEHQPFRRWVVCNCIERCTGHPIDEAIANGIDVAMMTGCPDVKCHACALKFGANQVIWSWPHKNPCGCPNHADRGPIRKSYLRIEDYPKEGDLVTVVLDDPALDLRYDAAQGGHLPVITAATWKEHRGIFSRPEAMRHTPQYLIYAQMGSRDCALPNPIHMDVEEVACRIAYGRTVRDIRGNDLHIYERS